MSDTEICTVDGCAKAVSCRQMCGMHYWRVRKFGSTDLPRGRALRTRGWPLADRVAFYARPATTGCVEWGAYIKNDGYGVLYVEGRRRLAHQVSYELTHGPIPEGLELDHLCRNRACINPEHLEPVTHAENMRRAQAIKTHCPSGHAYADDNLIVDGKGHRYCRECHRASGRATYRRQRVTA